MKVKCLKLNRFKFLFSVIMVVGLLATVITGAWAQNKVITLGKAADYAILGYNILLQNCDVWNGRVGVGYNNATEIGLMRVQDFSVVHDAPVYQDPSATLRGFRGPDNLMQGVVIQEMDPVFADAMQAYNDVLLLTPDLTITGSINSPTTITATHGGQFVILITGDIASQLVLVPYPGVPTKIIVILQGTITLNGSNTVGASSSTGAHDVLIVVEGPGSALTSRINNEVYGTILAPYRQAFFRGFYGSLIGNDLVVSFWFDCQIYLESYTSYDYGDAQSPYPTLFAENGARHIIDWVHYLGNSVDANLDGQTDLNALGDDNDIVFLSGDDDENGVTFPATLILGGKANITVTASATGILNAWFDFNGDGDWADADEQIFTNRALNAGANALSFNIPANAVVGATFARFRFSTVGGLSYDGLAPDGEVEDYKVEINAVDFGDAPDPSYPTLLANNGARHIIDDVHYLGAGIDPDADGQPNAIAKGDDNDGNDDEDGVTFIGLPLIQFSSHTVQVVASAPGYLNAWMDFNQDGDWNDANEHIIVDQSLEAGINDVTFSIPLINDTPPERIIRVISRFRFSTQQGLSYDGLAPDGEVEDYMVDVQIPVELTTFVAASASGAVNLSWVTESESENLGYYVFRSMVEADGYVRISKDMIKGAGNSTDSHNYSYTDSDVKAGNKYFYKLCSVDYNGYNRFYGPISVTVEGTTSVKEFNEVTPSNYSLDQNYPNPFNPETAITFSLKEAGPVSLKIYNIQGQVVRTLLDQSVAAGKYAVMWNGTNDQGVRLVSGIYIYALQVNGFKETRKLNLMK